MQCFVAPGIMINSSRFAVATSEFEFFVKLFDGLGGLDPVYQSCD